MYLQGTIERTQSTFRSVCGSQMLGDKIKPRRSRLRSKLSNLRLFLAVSFEILVAKTALLTLLTFDRHCPVEAFVPLHRRIRGFCVASPRSRRITSSSCSILIPIMAFSHDGDKGNEPTNSNHRQLQGNNRSQQPKKGRDPRHREATTNAAPVYITIGKSFALAVTVLFRPYCGFYVSFPMMIERVPEWSSPRIAKCGFVVPKGPMSWILVAASNYTR